MEFNRETGLFHSLIKSKGKCCLGVARKGGFIQYRDFYFLQLGFRSCKTHVPFAQLNGMWVADLNVRLKFYFKKSSCTFLCLESVF